MRCGSRMILFPAFIDPERCQHLVKTAQARLAPSGLALRKTEGPQETECAPHTQHCLTALPRLNSSHSGSLMGDWEFPAAEHPPSADRQPCKPIRPWPRTYHGKHCC